MSVVFDRDMSVREKGIIRGLRIITAKGPYPLIKFEVDVSNILLISTFTASVWHPSNGWLTLVEFVEDDFPFRGTDFSLEGCYSHMRKTVQEIFAMEPDPKPEAVVRSL